MQEMLRHLQEVLRGGGAVAYTMLVDTRGSTPQKPGAAMLVFPDGSQVGTLGGGCVEAEVKRSALRLLDAGGGEILSYVLDDDHGWDDGLICGGRMSMLVEPLRPGVDVTYFERLSGQVAGGHGCTEAVLIDAEQAGGGSVADRWLFDHNGEILASRGSNQAPPALRDHIRQLSQRPKPYVVQGIAYLPHLKRARLLVVGGGHVGEKVADLAAEADFDIWVVDDREKYCNPERFPQAQRLIVDEIGPALSGLEVDADTFCVIVTRGHRHDEEALYHLAETDAGYVGMIGSKRKIKLIYDDLLREGISRDALARVHAPLGFNIGSQTVTEIAISIVAELIACRNLGAVPQASRGSSVLLEMQAADEPSAAGRHTTEPTP